MKKFSENKLSPGVEKLNLEKLLKTYEVITVIQDLKQLFGFAIIEQKRIVIFINKKYQSRKSEIVEFLLNQKKL